MAKAKHIFVSVHNCLFRGTNLPWFKICSSLFLVSIMYINMFKNKANNILMKDKSEPQHIDKDML